MDFMPNAGHDLAVPDTVPLVPLPPVDRDSPEPLAAQAERILRAPSRRASYAAGTDGSGPALFAGEALKFGVEPGRGSDAIPHATQPKTGQCAVSPALPAEYVRLSARQPTS